MQRGGEVTFAGEIAVRLWRRPAAALPTQGPGHDRPRVCPAGPPPGSPHVRHSHSAPVAGPGARGRPDAGAAPRQLPIPERAA
jgi:hypothetical protein